MKQNQKSNIFCQLILSTTFILFLLLLSTNNFAQSNISIIGKVINCKESVSTIDYEQYSIANSNPNAIYNWTIVGSADFNTLKTTTGTHVTVRFLDQLGDVTLTVTESIQNQITATKSLVIQNV